MTAIVGLVGPHTADSLHAMAARLEHRGLLSRFETVDGRVSVGALGQDAERMVHRTGSTVAVAAGQIYSLRDETMPSAPDVNIAELLSRQFQSGGVAGLASINGDFAAAICSINGAGVTLLRDYFGCVPLFWSVLDDGCLAFASEYKALFALRGFSPVVDRPMLQHLQSTKRIPVGRTLLGNVAAARPGVTLIEQNRVSAYENFTPLTADIRLRDEETAKATVAREFREATRSRSGKDTPLGLALSGGIDSIAMAFQLRNLFPDREFHTFTAGYGDDDPEMSTAAEVADEVGSIHHPVITPPSLVATSLGKLVWHMEDPGSRSEALQLMRIGEVASGHVPLLLSGQGADGLFAGMLRHRLLKMAGRIPLLNRPLFEVFDLTQSGLQPATPAGRMLATLAYRGKVPPVPRVIGGGDVLRPKRTRPGPDFLNRSLAAGYQDSAYQDACKFERTFAASGVGYTSPYLDVSFARMALTIDERLKIVKGIEKHILRASVDAIVPEKFRAVPKHPQRMRYDVAFADCLDEVASEVLSPFAVNSRGLFEPRTIDRLRRRTAGRAYHAEAAMRLWTAVVTEIWARLFLDGKGVNQPGP